MRNNEDEKKMSPLAKAGGAAGAGLFGAGYYKAARDRALADRYDRKLAEKRAKWKASDKAWEDKEIAELKAKSDQYVDPDTGKQTWKDNPEVEKSHRRTVRGREDHPRKVRQKRGVGKGGVNVGDKLKERYGRKLGVGPSEIRKKSTARGKWVLQPDGTRKFKVSKLSRWLRSGDGIFGKTPFRGARLPALLTGIR